MGTETQKNAQLSTKLCVRRTEGGEQVGRCPKKGKRVLGGVREGLTATSKALKNFHKKKKNKTTQPKPLVSTTSKSVGGGEKKAVKRGIKTGGGVRTPDRKKRKVHPRPEG